MVSKSSSGCQKKNVDADVSSSLSQRGMKKRETCQRALLLLFASVSTFLYAGGVYGWGPMQLLLEENGNFASRCYSDLAHNNANITYTDDDLVCPEQTEAFLTCKFVSQLTMLSGTTWGFFSDRYGKKVLTYGFLICNIVGLLLLIVAIEFPLPVVEDISLYGAFILMGFASTVGGMLTVETGMLFKSDQKQQNRVIALLNALFDAGAMAYLGLWGLEKITSSATGNTNLILIIVGFLFLAGVCLGGYTYYFHAIQAKNDERDCMDTNSPDQSNADDEEANAETFERRITAHTIVPLSLNESGDISMKSTDSILGEDTMQVVSNSSEPSKEENALCPTYTPIAERAPTDQMKSKAYVLLSIWFSFYSTANHWTLTMARDHLGMLGDDAYGNLYLSIFSLLTPFSIIALPFLDMAINKRGFHGALQAVNVLAIIHEIIKIWCKNLNVQIIGFVVFTFFRCFLYSVGLSCVASFIGPTAIGKAVGTLYVTAGVVSFFNIGLAHWAMEEGDFFLPNLLFLVVSIPMVYLTYHLGKALEKDQCSKN